ncbi:hypothetical protein [Actinocorallia longicatena]|uniref:Uncharacterized protein n=1 Tax=Actinocorallia longicatena TaxID=111803 RepID=A0ABP6QHG1_9ACTN
MGTAKVNQIELRWRQNSDFGPVAYSTSASADPQYFQRWWVHLAEFASPPLSEETRADSLVYLVFPGTRQAAIIYRCFDEKARKLYTNAPHEDGNRNVQVARAIVGGMDAVSTDLALAWMARGAPLDLLGAKPGQAARDDVLPGINPAELAEFARSGAVETRGELRIQRMVAAALREPKIPLGIMLPEDMIRMPLRNGTQLPLLRGLFSVLGPMLTSAKGDLLNEWRPSFSTFEPHSRAGLQGAPRIMFRSEKMPETPPNSKRREAVFRPFSESPGDEQGDLADRTAQCLVKAYEALPSKEFAENLMEATAYVEDLTARMEAVLSNAEFLRFAPDKLAPARSASYPPVRSRADEDYRVAEPVRTSTAFNGAATAGGFTLADLYRELGRLEGDKKAIHVATKWIAAAGRHGVRLQEQAALQALATAMEHQWFDQDLRTIGQDEDLAGRSIADLLGPMVLRQQNEDVMFAKLAETTRSPDAPESWHLAMGELYGRLPGSSIKAFEAAVLPALLEWLGRRGTAVQVDKPAPFHPVAPPLVVQPAPQPRRFLDRGERRDGQPEPPGFVDRYASLIALVATVIVVLTVVFLARGA